MHRNRAAAAPRPARLTRVPTSRALPPGLRKTSVAHGYLPVEITSLAYLGPQSRQKRSTDHGHTVPDTTLGRIRCPAFSRVFPKNRCERAASGISPDTKNFFAKNVFHTKATPLWDRTIFGQVFGRGGMIKFSKWKVPPTGGSSAP
jgi:hypothetical protein